MTRMEYKADSFGCTLSGRKKFDEQLQELLDRYAGDGWQLHSYHVVEGGFCSVVFYREARI